MLLSDKEEVFGNFDLIKSTVFDTADLEKKQAELQNVFEVVAGMMQQAIVLMSPFSVKIYQSYHQSDSNFDIFLTSITEIFDI